MLKVVCYGLRQLSDTDTRFMIRHMLQTCSGCDAAEQINSAIVTGILPLTCLTLCMS